MNKLFITAIMAMSFVAMPVVAQQTTMTKAEIKAAIKAEKAQKKKEKEQSSSSSAPVVAPKPVVTPKPVTTTPVAPAPTPVAPTPVAPAPIVLTPWQQQVQTLHPLATCTYCAAYAASQGNFDLVDAIGSPYTQPTASEPAAPAPTTTEPASAPTTESAPVSEPSAAAADATVDTAVTQ